MSDQTSTTWHIWRNGPVGPLAQSHIVELLKVGTLQYDDPISFDGGKHWITVSDAFSPEPDESIVQQETSRSRQLSDADFFKHRKVMHLAQKAWKIPIVKFLVIVGVAPLLALQLISHSTQISILFWGCYFCVLWAAVTFEIIRPPRQMLTGGLATFLFTIFAGVPLLHFMQVQFPATRELYNHLVTPIIETEKLRLMPKLLAFLTIGVFEESIKLLPVFILVRKKRYQSPAYLIWLGMMSAFGFAISENINYSYLIIQGGAAQAVGSSSGGLEVVQEMTYAYGTVLSFQLARFISLPLLHACWTVIGGLCAWKMWTRMPVVWAMCVGLFSATGLHCLYNMSVSMPLMAPCTALVSFLIFSGLVLQEAERRNGELKLR